MISATQIQTIRVIRLCLFTAIVFLTGSVMRARATTFVVTNTNDSGPALCAMQSLRLTPAPDLRANH